MLTVMACELVCVCMGEGRIKKEIKMGVGSYSSVFVCDKMLKILLALHFITDQHLPCSPALSTGVSVTAL